MTDKQAALDEFEQMLSFIALSHRYWGTCDKDFISDKAVTTIRQALTVPQVDVDGYIYGIIDPDYARVFSMARCLARSEGYALLFHGSFTRDLDLIAVPWTSRATEPVHLLRRIEAASGLRCLDEKGSTKEHGRIAWTLVFKGFGDPRFIDFSIMPRGLIGNAPIFGEEEGDETIDANVISPAVDKALRHLRAHAEWQPLDNWHEDDGPAFWTKFPVCEPYYAGSPLDTKWPGYHTHFIPMSVFDRLIDKDGNLIQQNTPGTSDAAPVAVRTQAGAPAEPA